MKIRLAATSDTFEPMDAAEWPVAATAGIGEMLNEPMLAAEKPVAATGPTRLADPTDDAECAIASTWTLNLEDAAVAVIPRDGDITRVWREG